MGAWMLTGDIQRESSTSTLRPRSVCHSGLSRNGFAASALLPSASCQVLMKMTSASASLISSGLIFIMMLPASAGSGPWLSGRFNPAS